MPDGEDGADDVAGEAAGGCTVAASLAGLCCGCPCPRRVRLGDAGGVDDPASDGGRCAAARLRGGLLPLVGGSGGGAPPAPRAPGAGGAGEAEGGTLPSLGVGGSPLEQAMEQ